MSVWPILLVIYGIDGANEFFTIAGIVFGLSLPSISLAAFSIFNFIPISLRMLSFVLHQLENALMLIRGWLFCDINGQDAGGTVENFFRDIGFLLLHIMKCVLSLIGVTTVILQYISSTTAAICQTTISQLIPAWSIAIKLCKLCSIRSFFVHMGLTIVFYSITTYLINFINFRIRCWRNSFPVVIRDNEKDIPGPVCGNVTVDVDNVDNVEVEEQEASNSIHVANSDKIVRDEVATQSRNTPLKEVFTDSETITTESSSEGFPTDTVSSTSNYSENEESNAISPVKSIAPSVLFTTERKPRLSSTSTSVSTRSKPRRRSTDIYTPIGLAMASSSSRENKSDALEGEESLKIGNGSKLLGSKIPSLPRHSSIGGPKLQRTPTKINTRHQNHHHPQSGKRLDDVDRFMALRTRSQFQNNLVLG